MPKVNLTSYGPRGFKTPEDKLLDGFWHLFTTMGEHEPGGPLDIRALKLGILDGYHCLEELKLGFAINRQTGAPVIRNGVVMMLTSSFIASYVSGLRYRAQEILKVIESSTNPSPKLASIGGIPFAHEVYAALLHLITFVEKRAAEYATREATAVSPALINEAENIRNIIRRHTTRATGGRRRKSRRSRQ